MRRNLGSAWIIWLATSGCLDVAVQSSQFQCEVVLIDTSASLSSDLAVRVHEGVLHQAEAWVVAAQTGHSFCVWWLTCDGRYPAEHARFTMPAVRPPATVHREEASQSLLEEVEACVGGLPRGVRRTQLLESLQLVSLVQDEPYALTIYTDLQQDSEQLDIVSAVRERERAVSAMLEIAPPPRTPPAVVRLVTWPGVGGGGVAVAAHHELREIFVDFLGNWAPGARVHVGAIQ